MTPTKRLRSRQGFTIAELIVSMVVLGTVIAASTATLVGIQRQYTSQRATTEARETIRSVEIVLQRAFRNARVNPRNMAAANVAMVVNPLGRTGAEWNNVDIRGDFNPIDATVNGDWEDVRVELTSDTVYVRWKKAGAREPVAYPVSQLRFQFYDLAGTELTIAATAAASARRVKVTMSVPVPKTSKTLQRESWIFLRN
jgi:prepilin-type N-terminal cleavage/methylation domain-containing protein